LLNTSGQWATEIRPGVAFPDWSVIHSRQANDALVAILAAFGADTCWRDYSADEDRVRSSIIRHYARVGRSPSLSELKSATGMADDGLNSVLLRLRERDLVVMDDERIVGAYPLTERMTDHEVWINGTTVHAMCAVDALGAGAMFGQNIEISSSCRHCRAPITVSTQGAGTALETFAPPGTIVWSGIRNSEGCAADTLCTVIAFFCSDDHLEAWRRQNHPHIEGYRLSLAEALQVGRAIFAPSLAGLDLTLHDRR
jgi:mercuric reductase